MYGCRTIKIETLIINNRPPSLSLTFGRQGGYYTITGRLQIPTRAARQTFWVAGVLFPYGAQSGRRAR